MAGEDIAVNPLPNDEQWQYRYKQSITNARQMETNHYKHAGNILLTKCGLGVHDPGVF